MAGGYSISQKVTPVMLCPGRSVDIASFRMTRNPDKGVAILRKRFVDAV
jgi:hypothetical protein